MRASWRRKASIAQPPAWSAGAAHAPSPMEDLLRALASKLRSRRQSQPVSARLTLFVREKVNEQLEKDTDYRCHGDRRGSIRKRKRSFAGKLARRNPRDRRKSRERGHDPAGIPRLCGQRSEEHKSELQSLMRISYAVFRL